MLQRLLTPVVALALLGQVAAGPWAAALIWRLPTGLSGAACQCPHGGSALVCPMHKAPAKAARCTLRSQSGVESAILGSILGVAGVLPESVSPQASAETSAALPTSAVAPRAIFSVPDPPPPRG